MEVKLKIRSKVIFFKYLMKLLLYCAKNIFVKCKFFPGDLKLYSTGASKTCRSITENN